VLIHGDIKSGIDETVAIIAFLFETIAFTLRQLPNGMFALHLFTTTIVGAAKSPAPIHGWFYRLQALEQGTVALIAAGSGRAVMASRTRASGQVSRELLKGASGK
jgi:hypothetical protein